MALNNNIYFNAAYIGFLEGALEGRKTLDATAADYLALTQAAQAYATEVDSLIAFDALVTTANNDPSQLAQTTHTITANEQFRAGLLQSLSRAAVAGSSPSSTTAASYASVAAAVKAQWTEGLLLVVTP